MIPAIDRLHTSVSIPQVSIILKLSFNQEYEQFKNKYRTRGKKSTFSAMPDYQAADVVEDAIISGLIDDFTTILSLGSGKEAEVILGEKNGDPVVVKSFRPYSASNIKRYSAQYHVLPRDMASVMAKTEYSNLKILHFYNINVPQPLEFAKNGMGFSMRLVADSHGRPAQSLKFARLENFCSPEEFLYLILDQIELIFDRVHMVHGDLSEFNILVSNNKPWIIDVSQSRLYNFETFMQTPVRIRIDKAIQVLFRDIEKILHHFRFRYRIDLSFDDVLNRILAKLPNFTKKYNIQSWINKDPVVHNRRDWKYFSGGPWLEKKAESNSEIEER